MAYLNAVKTRGSKGIILLVIARGSGVYLSVFTGSSKPWRREFQNGKANLSIVHNST